MELLDQIGKLDIVPNSFTTGNKDWDESYKTGPLIELMANQVEAFVGKRHSEDIWGGARILPLTHNHKVLEIRFASKSTQPYFEIYRVRDVQYVILGSSGGSSQGYS